MFKEKYHASLGLNLPLEECRNFLFIFYNRQHLCNEYDAFLNALMAKLGKPPKRFIRERFIFTKE